MTSSCKCDWPRRTCTPGTVRYDNLQQRYAKMAKNWLLHALPCNLRCLPERRHHSTATLLATSLVQISLHGTLQVWCLIPEVTLRIQLPEEFDVLPRKIYCCLHLAGTLPLECRWNPTAWSVAIFIINPYQIKQRLNKLVEVLPCIPDLLQYTFIIGIPGHARLQKVLDPGKFVAVSRNVFTSLVCATCRACKLCHSSAVAHHMLLC